MGRSRRAFYRDGRAAGINDCRLLLQPCRRAFSTNGRTGGCRPARRRSNDLLARQGNENRQDQCPAEMDEPLPWARSGYHVAVKWNHADRRLQMSLAVVPEPCVLFKKGLRRSKSTGLEKYS